MSNLDKLIAWLRFVWWLKTPSPPRPPATGAKENWIPPGRRPLSISSPAEHDRDLHAWENEGGATHG